MLVGRYAYVLHVSHGLSGRVVRVDKVFEEFHLDFGVSDLQLADSSERELDVLSRLDAAIEDLKHVSHARLDVVARESGLVRNGRVVKRVNRYATGHGVLVVRETMILGELLRDGKNGPLEEHVFVIADVELFLYKTKRAESWQGNAF